MFELKPVKVPTINLVDAAGPDIDTGSGGFDIDGKQQTFDVGAPEPTNTTSPYGKFDRTVDVDSDLLDSTGKPKDLTTVTKTTLSHYLSDLTQGKSSAPGSTPVANKYPIDRKVKQISIVDKNSEPTLQSPGIVGSSNSHEFQPKQSSLTALSDAYATISGEMQKGKSSLSVVDGNALLQGVIGNNKFTALGPSSATSPSNPVGMPEPGITSTAQAIASTTASPSNAVVESYQSAVMKSNRFTASSTFAGSTAPNDAIGFNPGLSNQFIFGEYAPGNAGVNMGRMALVGPLLTMRAAGELGATSPGADPNSDASEAGALLPGLAQLGLSRVEQQKMLASDVFGPAMVDLTKDEPQSSYVLSVGSNSWGNLNDVDDPFSGMDAIGMTALSFALVAGLELLFDVVETLLGLIPASTKVPGRDAQGRFNVGEYYTGTKAGNAAAGGGIGGAVSAIRSSNFAGLLGIKPTNFPFQQALSAGTNAFFQVPSGGGALKQLVGAATSSVDSPGYNAIVARAITRSGVTLVDQLKKIGGNPMNVISQLLSLADVLASSKLIAACNIFAMLGDAVLSEPKEWLDNDANARGYIKNSSMDHDPDVGSPVSKNRLLGSLKLAWASNRAGANLLVPSSVVAVNTIMGGNGLGSFNPLMGLGCDVLSKVMLASVKSSDAGRINSADAATFEQSLEATYVPFYFHDVRTNEMVAFHAFLASLTDDYAAAYERSEGFGRVDPVRIYKSTERKIGMSFYVIATSLQDFDEMWVKLNKLVTLVYPQYTQGVQLSSADGASYKFTQPFSQLIGASPLIRIRLGDLFRSNYTPFALGRLFGLGNQDFSIAGETLSKAIPSADAIDNNKLAIVKKALQDAVTWPGPSKYIPAPGIYPSNDTASPGGLAGLAAAATSIFGGSATPTPPYATEFDCMQDSCFEVIVTNTSSPRVVVGQVQLRTDQAFTSNLLVSSQFALKYGGKDPSKKYVDQFGMAGGTYLFPTSALKMTDDSARAIIQNRLKIDEPSTQNFMTALTNFLNPNSNAVAKSFQDTAGKGLAGVIESMHFDWYDKVTWETQDGRVAPKMCKVTIQFAPVHDISPGIDHMGFNRAPVYPVGPMGGQTNFIAQPSTTPSVPGFG